MALMTTETQNKKSNPSNTSKTIGTYLLDRLWELGVQHIFGIPGDYILRFDKLIENHSIQFVNATRENTAGYMADAYARLRGLGVACITYGVGINIANALSQAYVENSPLIVISGAAGTDEFAKCQHLHHLINSVSHSGSSDSTQHEIFRQITVAQAILDNPATAAAQIDEVLNACLRHQKPVYIEIPRNSVDAPIIEHTPAPNFPFKVDHESLDEAMIEIESILLKAKKPVIWAGHEILRYGLSSSLIKFAERYHIPIATTLLGKTAISEKHPLSIGVYQGGMSRTEVQDFVEDCDCLIMLGVILSDVDTGIFSADLHPPSLISAEVENLTICHHHFHHVPLYALVDKLASLDLNLRFRHPFPANIDRRIVKFTPQPQTPTTSARLFECVQSHLTGDHILVADIGDCLFGSVDLMLEERSFIAGSYFGSLGFGTPAAVGAQLAAPKRRVVAIIGDGAFQMTSMELSTAVRYGLDPIIIVLNNHGYGTERPLLEGSYNDIVDWKYTEIPKVLNGGIGLSAKTEEEFSSALEQALSTRGQFYLIEVELGKTDFSPGLRRLASIISKRK